MSNIEPFFRVHEQNTASLILAFLPYHGHPIFARLMTVIPPKSLPIALSFLMGNLNPPTCTPRSSIVKSLTAHADFFNLLTSYVLRLVERGHAHHALVSFYITVTVEVLNRMCSSAIYRKNTQDIITKVMPMLIQGLKAQGNPEFQIGQYMIITVLVAKLPLEDKLLHSLMAEVVQGWSKESISPGLACVALLAQERKERQPLPAQVIKGLFKIEGLGQILVQMGEKYRVDELAASFASAILQTLNKYGLKGIKFVRHILLHVKLPSARRKCVLVQLLQTVTQVDIQDDAAKTEVAEFLLTLAEGTSELGKILQVLLTSEGIDVETLEMRLQTVIRPLPSPIEAPARAAHAVAPVKADPSVAFDELLSSLPESTVEVSYLSPTPSPLFPALSQAFLLAVSLGSIEKMERLLNHPLFQNKPVYEAFTLSFLIKIWTSKTHPALARAAALSRAQTILNSSTSPLQVDFQALLPYMLIALADPNRKVRAEAAALILCFASSLKKEEQGRNKNDKTSIKFWGFDTIFGKGTKETEECKWMETKEARKLVERVGIVNSLEEAILDKWVVARVIGENLGRSGEGLGKSLRVTTMAFLSSHVLGVTDLAIKFELLKLVNSVTSGAASRNRPAVMIITDWVSVDDYNRSEASLTVRCGQEGVDIKEIETEIARAVGPADKGRGLDLLISIMRGSFGTSPEQIGGMRIASSLRVREIWTDLKLELRTRAAQGLLDIGTAEKIDVDVAGEAMDILKHVSLPMELFEVWLQHSLLALKSWTAILGRGAPGGSEPQQISKRRKPFVDVEDSHPGEPTTLEANINRLTMVLELLEARPMGEKDVNLLKLGFGILGEVMNVAGEIGAGVGYLLQLLLGILSSIVSYIKVRSLNSADLED